MRLAVVLIAVAGATAGCLRQTQFQCTDNQECSGGMCERSGFCSFGDASCAGGRRYGELSGMYANQCVGNTLDASIDSPPGSQSIGGTVTGLTGTGLVLQDNGGDNRAITANGPFMFPTLLAQSSAYSVTVLTPPSGQSVLLGNATGTVGTMPVANITVQCTTVGVDPGIDCNGVYCAVGTQQCCRDTADTGGMCTGTGGVCNTSQVPMLCDDTADCNGMVCCAHLANSGALRSPGVGCVTSVANCTSSGGGSVQILCDPTAPTPCPNLGFCQQDTLHGWFHC